MCENVRKPIVHASSVVVIVVVVAAADTEVIVAVVGETIAVAVFAVGLVVLFVTSVFEIRNRIVVSVVVFVITFVNCGYIRNLQ